jgi:hypothetical protein
VGRSTGRCGRKSSYSHQQTIEGARQLWLGGFRQLANDLAGGVQETNHRRAIGGNLEDDAVATVGVLQLECDRFVDLPSQIEALVVRGVGLTEFCALGFLLVSGKTWNAVVQRSQFARGRLSLDVCGRRNSSPSWKRIPRGLAKSLDQIPNDAAPSMKRLDQLI